MLGLYASECANTKINNNVFSNLIFSNIHTDNIVFSSSHENDVDHYIFGINYAYKLRVLLAVEMQAGFRVYFPELYRTVLYCTVWWK